MSFLKKNFRYSVVLSLPVVLLYACGAEDASSTFRGTDGGASGDAGRGTSFGTSDGGGGNPDGSSLPPTLCGNGIKNAETELCDDGNSVAGDGCSSTCRVEPGWLCLNAGRACAAVKCGDGIVAGDEDCDDGNNNNQDGCSSACRLETGFKCATPGAPCTPTVCGDGIREGAEQCDDNNRDPFDGCDPDCRVEPKCANGSCTSSCGDGLKFPAEACDDGNGRSGDGCSNLCALEPGYACTNAEDAAPATKVLYIAYRDFLSSAAAGGHPDFMTPGMTYGLATGLLKPSLDAAGKPELLSSNGSAAGPVIKDATSFSSWYRDTAFSKKTVSTLSLAKQANGTYQFKSSAFFPLDTAANIYPERHNDDNGVSHNFLFTSELRIPFTYRGGETLSFTGDDDVWVFVNNKLVVDLGGVKEAMSSTVVLNNAVATQAGLSVGGMYEFVVFQAERNPTHSEYTLTLTDFERIKTSCKSVCGDGVKTPDEVCDDGAAQNTGAYGRCMPDCSKRGPFCGDGIVQSANGELCDSTPDCASDCRPLTAAPK